MSGRIDYPATVMARARELREYGTEITDIQHRLQREFGASPSQSTISRWCSEKVRARELVSGARRSARRRAATYDGRLVRPGMSPECKFVRMRALAELGISEHDIGVLMGFDLGDELTRWQVRRALSRGKYPKNPGRFDRAADRDVQQWVADGVIAA